MEISNGLLLNENTTAYLSEYVKSVRVELSEAARREYLIDIAKAAQSLYIGMSLGVPVNLMNSHFSDSGLARAVGKGSKNPQRNKRMLPARRIFEIAREFADSKRVNCPLKPYIILDQETASEYNACIHVYPIEGKTLIEPDTCNPNYMYILCNSIHTTPYKYWDDADEEYMEKNWNQKKQDWHEAFAHPVFNKTTKRNEYGFTVSVINAAKDIDITLSSLVKDSLKYMQNDFPVVKKAMEIKLKNEYLQKIQGNDPKSESQLTGKQVMKNMDMALKMYDEHMEENNQKIQEAAKKINTVEFFSCIQTM